MTKQLTFLLVAVLIAASFSISSAYAFEPQTITLDLQDAQITSFETYDVLAIILSIFNTDSQDAYISGHSMMYLNDTTGDHWEYSNYLDLETFTESDCSNMDTIIAANSTQNVKLCFIIPQEVNIGYEVVLNNHNFIKDMSTNEIPIEFVPDSFKTTSSDWCSYTITDTDFVNSVQTNIDQRTIITTSTQSGVDVGEQLPSWIKDNACLWSSDKFYNVEFLSGIYWLINNGKILL